QTRESFEKFAIAKIVEVAAPFGCLDELPGRRNSCSDTDPFERGAASVEQAGRKWRACLFDSVRARHDRTSLLRPRGNSSANWYGLRRRGWHLVVLDGHRKSDISCGLFLGRGRNFSQVEGRHFNRGRLRWGQQRKPELRGCL